MSNTKKFVLALAIILFLGSVAPAQEASANAGAAPIPTLIASAKKVFISNGGADSGLFPHPFSGAPDRGYSQFYVAMKAWGHYELVGDPSDAELILEFRLHAPNGPANADKSKGASDPVPMFRLVIYDRKTHYILWALTESIEAAAFQKTHDRNFDDGLANLMLDLKTLVGKNST
jgi:hypothetical protein